ncbi:MAG TPA: hypothetical protein VF529_04375 [Solirubrobacteraceae bacterium]|jgi:hypothetical protein
MRKLWVVGAAAMLVLALAAIAVAQEGVTNTYDVEGSTVPKAKGSKKKPIPIGINFDYTVGEAQNRRPSPIKKYSIRFGLTQVNTKVVPGCSKATLDNEGPDGCPAKSIVGTGFIENETGDRTKPEDKSITCNASVQVINGTDANSGNLYVKGSPGSSDPRTKCAIELAAPIPFRFVKRGVGANQSTAMEFEVPDTLLHPLPTLSNAVKRVTSKVKRLTKKIKGKRRGYFEAIGCNRGKRRITVVFTPEDGDEATAQTETAC